MAQQVLRLAMCGRGHARTGAFRWLAATAAVLAVPALAYADGGTVLFGARSLHLIFGNALIGVLEGVLIAGLFRARFLRAAGLMVLANYASAITADVFLRVGEGRIVAWLLGSEPLYALPNAWRLLILATFIETVLVEWPFCLVALKPGRYRLARSVAACLVAQVMSYSVLVLYYRPASTTTLFTEMTVDRSTVAEATEPAVVYFTSPAGDAVCRINLNGEGFAKIRHLDTPHPWAKLFFRRSAGGKRWDLCMANNVVLLQDLPVHAAGWRFRGIGEEEVRPYEVWPDVCDLRTAPDPAWTVEAAKSWLVVRNNRSEEHLLIGLETPIVSWYARHPTILPGDKVVCQFGDQILLLDLNRRRVGLLALGRSPVVALDDGVPATQTQAAESQPAP